MEGVLSIIGETVRSVFQLFLHHSLFHPRLHDSAPKDFGLQLTEWRKVLQHELLRYSRDCFLNMSSAKANIKGRY